MTTEIKCAYKELVPISELKPHPKNRNKHPSDQITRLAEIISFQGIRSPIKVSTRSGFITAGHGRLEALRHLRIKDAPVDYQDYDSDEQEYADLQADNAIALWAELDLSGINMDVPDLGPDFDINMMGIRDFTLEPAEKFPQCDEDEVPDHVEPKTNLGDIYQLGDHRLMCGDSTSIDAVDKLTQGREVDLVLTDPPYNQETEGGFAGPIGSDLRNQSKEITHLCDFEPEEFLNVLRSLFSGGMNAMVFTSKDLIVDYLKWSKDNGYAYNILVWKKPNAIPIGGSYRPDIEYLLVFRKSAIFNSNLEGVSYSKVLEFGREKNKVHPMKPVGLLENQILIGSKNSVLDLFGGSGSTLIACENTSRKCFMMELDPHYCDVIVTRWEKYTGKTAELTNGQT